ncbi:MAG: hypothetical protein GJ680_13415 [Alteromonadaceae bacterium]|nr:hypothetical protein [Alteromonadaceae bacterium]
MKPLTLSGAAFLFLALGILLIAAHLLWQQDYGNALYFYLGLLSITQSLLVSGYRTVEGDMTVKALHQSYLKKSGRLAKNIFLTFFGVTTISSSLSSRGYSLPITGNLNAKGRSAIITLP